MWKLNITPRFKFTQFSIGNYTRKIKIGANLELNAIINEKWTDGFRSKRNIFG